MKDILTRVLTTKHRNTICQHALIVKQAQRPRSWTSRGCNSMSELIGCSTDQEAPRAMASIRSRVTRATMTFAIVTVGCPSSPKGRAALLRLVPRFMKVQLEHGVPLHTRPPWRRRRISRTARKNPAVLKMLLAAESLISYRALLSPAAVMACDSWPSPANSSTKSRSRTRSKRSAKYDVANNNTSGTPKEMRRTQDA